MRAFRDQATAWAAYYAGKFEEAAKQAEPLLKNEYEGARVEAAYCQARCLWAGGSKADRTRAVQTWSVLEKTSTIQAHLERMKISRALVLEGDGKTDQAIEVLMGVIRDAIPATCTAEAGIDLARLLVEVKRFDDARKALESVVAFLDLQAKSELSTIAAEPFRKAAQAALDRLPNDKDPGRAAFEKAQALRAARKFTEALEGYQGVIRDFPDTDYMPRSELSVGYCLIGLKKPLPAIDQWKTFIATSPSGPWRGQAYVGILDAYLQDVLDLDEADKYAKMTCNALANGQKGEGQAESWRAAAYDIFLRSGIVALVRGRRDEATRLLEQASGSPGGPSAAEDGLRRLLAVAKAGSALVPADVRDEKVGRQATLALSIALIYARLGYPEAAEGMFDRVLTGGLPGTVPQQSFAAFGKGISLQARKQSAEAKEALRESVRAYATGSWHDETLYCLASIILDQAGVQFEGSAHAPTADSATTKVVGSPEPLRGKERQEFLEGQKQQQDGLFRNRAEALPYWQELATRFPQSPKAGLALYNAGVLLLEAQQTDQAADALNRFVLASPGSPWAGDAYMRLFDLAMEHRFDPTAARELAAAALKWSQAQRVEEPQSAADTGLWVAQAAVPDPDTLRRVTYDLYLRAAVGLYLDRKPDQAIAMLKSARSYVSLPGHGGQGQARTNLNPVIEAIGKNSSLTPAEVLAGEPKAALASQLADLYFAAEEYEKAIALCTRVIEDTRPGVTNVQKSWACFRRGRNRYALPTQLRDPDGAEADYLAAVDLAPQAAWAYDCLFLAGNLEFNVNRNADAAVSLSRGIAREYPASQEAHRAAYYIGVAYESKHRAEEARQAYEEFLKNYPNSPFVNLVRTYHLKRLDQAQSQPTTR